MTIPNSYFMERAIEVAKSSFAAGDYAVGSVVVKDDAIISAAGNRTHLDQDPTQHAELIVIRDAAKNLKQKDLSGCELYATHEPCPMCMSAIIWSKISAVVFGATMEDHKQYRDSNGNAKWKWRVIDVPADHIASRGEPHVELVSGFMRDECLSLFHS